MKEKLTETYNKLAKDYELHVDTQSGFNAYYERPAMMRLLPDQMEGLSVLDAGCAAGWYTEQMIRRNAQVTAIDLSPEMVEACRRRVGERARLLACDLTDELPFEDASFHYIVSSLTLHYIENWTATFKEFSRVLKPGGRLLFSVHHPFMDFKHFDRPDYFARELLSEIWNKQEAGPVEVSFYRRPMQEIVSVTAAEFKVCKLVEPQPNLAQVESASSSIWRDKWYDYLMQNPHFLIMLAEKSDGQRAAD
ncbi:class I SAM-dependent methyltransferase [Paenibacillus sp. JCM 10914]|uniref:class I SAM-dependent methyltransferase n=1 Tax=Paenibacillus sp. JCM 10914 TaxID=1236974 RepID=UPI0003CC791A|nr:class I SAM-dependent methyltransferase [Paenibacillus sp. JCM 10914]GAE05590.1 methylase [Paenibacillus sp. JCM 10914]